MKKSISLPAKEIVSDDEKGKKFICDVCGHKFLAPDIKWQGTPYSQPMPCPRCGSRPASTMRHPFHIQACWWNVGSRSRNAKGNAESDEQGRNVPKSPFCGGLPRSSVEVSVMDMERRGRRTHATEIVQLLTKRRI